MNKKLLLVLIATFLLTSCGGTKDDYIYEGPDSVDIAIFDYENSATLQEGLGTIFTIDEQPISEQTLATFLSLIGTNDFYANKVIHTQKNQVLYPDPNDANNFNSHRDGDVDYHLHIYRSALMGLGDTIMPMASGIMEFLMRIGVALFLPLIIGQEGIFYAEVYNISK